MDARRVLVHLGKVVSKEMKSMCSFIKVQFSFEKYSDITKSRMFDVDRVVGVCCALLLRGKSQRMNLSQKIVSLILYSGDASKKVLQLHMYNYML